MRWEWVGGGAPSQKRRGDQEGRQHLECKQNKTIKKKENLTEQGERREVTVQ